jgi:hypothetical protein
VTTIAALWCTLEHAARMAIIALNSGVSTTQRKPGREVIKLLLVNIDGTGFAGKNRQQQNCHND